MIYFVHIFVIRELLAPVAFNNNCFTEYINGKKHVGWPYNSVAHAHEIIHLLIKNTIFANHFFPMPL